MNVADAMTPRDEVVTATLPGTRDDVLAYLQEQQFSSVPVIKDTDDGEEFRGLVSRERLIDQPNEDQLALLIDDGPTTTMDTTIDDLAKVMRETGARRVPVVDGRLEGIVTVTDVIRAIANGDVQADREVGALAGRQVNCVFAGTPLPVAERELSYADVPYAVVLDIEGEPTGMLTEVDIIDVARVVEGEEETGESIADEDDDWKWEGIKAVGSRYTPTRNVEFPNEPVSEFMTADLIMVSQRRTAQNVAKLMLTHDIEQVPTTRGDELVGIVTDMDLLGAI